METVKLARIVMELKPDMYTYLTPTELNTSIVLRDGIDVLQPGDALEIIQQSIFEHQKEALLH